MTGLISLRDLSREQLLALIDRAQEMRDGECPVDLLAGRTVTTMFFEPSTRTRLSFELAAQRLGAYVLDFAPEVSSTTKGESFRDTVLTLEAMGTDILVIRHSMADAAERIASWVGLPVVNAGTGRREHPTQTLADALTIRDHFGGLEGLRVGIVGDVDNSRVARGHLLAFPKLGMEMTLIGPKTLLPDSNPWGVRMTGDLDSELGELDVVYLLRVQRERGSGTSYPDDSGYTARFGMNSGRLASMKPSAVVMHPGPVNRGVEIDDSVVAASNSLILEQVANGVPMRMAVLASVAK
jgi:aspartate carbamoyltransferase catalytic subunit